MDITKRYLTWELDGVTVTLSCFLLGKGVSSFLVVCGLAVVGDSIKKYVQE